MSYYDSLSKIESLIIQYSQTNALALKSVIGVDKDLEKDYKENCFYFLKSRFKYSPADFLIQAG